MGAVESLLGSSLLTFIGVTLVLFGVTAIMTGRALALTWRPYWHALPYSILLALGCRFITFALFQGELLSGPGYLISAACLLAYATISYRFVLARRMVRQYPWLYESAGPLGWRAK